MFGKKKSKELSDILGSDKKIKARSGCKRQMPTIIVFSLLFCLFFGYQAYALYGTIDLKAEDLIYSLDISAKLEQPLSDADLTTAKAKLSSVGLTVLAEQYILSNLEGNTQTPTSNLQLTSGEFASLLVPMYYAKYGKATTIHEIVISYYNNDTPDQSGGGTATSSPATSPARAIATLSAMQGLHNSGICGGLARGATIQQQNAIGGAGVVPFPDNVIESDICYKIKVTSSFLLNVNMYDIKINETLYATEYFIYNKTQNTLTLSDYELLNVNSKYIKKADVASSKDSENFVLSFLRYAFIGGESDEKSFVRQLNYSGILYNKDTSKVVLYKQAD